MDTSGRNISLMHYQCSRRMEERTLVWTHDCERPLFCINVVLFIRMTMAGVVAFIIYKDLVEICAMPGLVFPKNAIIISKRASVPFIFHFPVSGQK